MRGCSVRFPRTFDLCSKRTMCEIGLRNLPAAAVFVAKCGLLDRAMQPSSGPATKSCGTCKLQCAMFEVERCNSIVAPLSPITPTGAACGLRDRAMQHVWVNGGRVRSAELDDATRYDPGVRPQGCSVRFARSDDATSLGTNCRVLADCCRVRCSRSDDATSPSYSEGKQRA